MVVMGHAGRTHRHVRDVGHRSGWHDGSRVVLVLGINAVWWWSGSGSLLGLGWRLLLLWGLLLQLLRRAVWAGEAWALIGLIREDALGW